MRLGGPKSQSEYGLDKISLSLESNPSIAIPTALSWLLLIKQFNGKLFILCYTTPRLSLITITK
jgi:hypothetical protein